MRYTSLRTKFVSICLITISLLVSFSVSAQDTEKGQKLFKGNCASCHALDKRLTGPALAGVADRVPKPSEEWLIKWIKNSGDLIKAGDAYAVKVFEEYNRVPMPAQSVSDQDVKDILAYIANPPAKKDDKTAPAAGAVAPVKEDGNTMMYVMFALALLFIVLGYLLSGIRNSLEKLIREKNNLPEPPVYTRKEKAYLWSKENKKLIAIITLIVVGYFSQAAWYSMKDIGVFTNYQPEQPINFSHKIHAGQNGINCQYCHSSVEKGKSAGVPSANVCMNCHKYVSEGPVTGKTEIAKIYAAMDYDAEKQTYGNNPKPIKWIRIHNLPDHVYFNHSQHVKVGKQECQTCHGPIQEMDTVKQFSPLTMGWCIDCHRKTEVKMEGNPYYTDLHAKLKEKFKGQPITVDKMGGIECGKCHY